MLQSSTFGGFGNLSWGLLRSGTTKFKHHEILSGLALAREKYQEVAELLVCPIFARGSMLYSNPFKLF